MENLVIKAVALLFALSMLLGLSACSIGEQPPQYDSAADAVANYELQTCIADDETLGNFDILYSYGDDPYEENLFWCDADIYNVYIIGIMLGSDEAYTDGFHLFDVSLLRSGEGIYYKRTVPEGYPTEAIVYTANGNTYIYAIAYNGLYGGISLIELDQLIVDADKYADALSFESSTDIASSTDTRGILVYWCDGEYSGEKYNIYTSKVTVESESKWHVWKAIKQANCFISSNCSLLSADPLDGNDNILVLNFSDRFYNIKESELELTLLHCIANTYIEAYELEAVIFMVDGEYYQTAHCEPGEQFTFCDAS